ncbi:hypothetical protein GBAR_LOCUS10551 [Geodia barretti]|uniref:Tryptophan-rich basic protein n=1 Tax=Geodia barretti TaxID=519541 RepID=A0AA35WK58_GEOBA|nr:hypothetical protein GBAR_LOCUS10551 [Geodia barretti]
MSTAVVISVNYGPLLLIFSVILVSKLLRSVLTQLSSWALRHVVPLPACLGRTRSELAHLKREIAAVSIADDFAVHSRLKRQQITKETELSMIEGEYRNTILKKQALVEALATILLVVWVLRYGHCVPGKACELLLPYSLKNDTANQ